MYNVETYAECFFDLRINLYNRPCKNNNRLKVNCLEKFAKIDNMIILNIKVLNNVHNYTRKYDCKTIVQKKNRFIQIIVCDFDNLKYRKAIVL